MAAPSDRPTSHAADASRTDADRAPRGHPPGLRVLFFAELWERFSFYGMRSLLTLYMTRQLRYSDQVAYGVYGAYGALVYAFPLLGGWLADRLLGYQLAITIGAVLMALGHFVMAFPQEGALYLALSLLCVGNGFFKPNISTLVGKLYAPGDPRRDAGFTIFYMGINIGGMAPLVAGTIGERVGWHYGFGLAGLGMLVGMVWFLAGRTRLEGHGRPPSIERLARPGALRLAPLHLVLLGTLIVVPIVAVALRRNDYLGYVLYLAGVIVFGSLIVEALRCPPVQRGRLLVALVLMACSTIFWALFEQMGSSLTLFTKRHIDRTIAGWTVPTAAFVAVNSFLIVVLALPFASLWTALKRRRRDPSIPMKFALGLLQIGLGYWVLVAGARLQGAAGLVPMIWLLLLYLLFTTGELALSPIGLSAMTKLAPDRLAATVMGAWFLASAYAHHFGGIVAKTTALSSNAIQAEAGEAALGLYLTVFWRLGWLAVGIGVLLALVAPLLQRSMHGIE